MNLEKTCYEAPNEVKNVEIVRCEGEEESSRKDNFDPSYEILERPFTTNPFNARSCRCYPVPPPSRCRC